MSQETYASNPANVRVSLFRFLRREAVSLIVVFVILLIVFGLLATFVWKWLWLGMLLWPVYFWLSYVGAKRLMTLGNVCAAKVVSLDPAAVAVYTDLASRPDAAYPAIVVDEISLSGLAGGAVKVGDRLAVSAFYQGEEETIHEHWATLSVIEPIRGATSDPAEIARTLNSIDKQDWQNLDAGYQSIGSPKEEGTHFLEQGRKAGGVGVTEGRVHLVAADDEDMKAVGAYGRKTFRFFMREWSWENRRIVPGLDMAYVKVAFSDPPEMRTNAPGELEVEYMWISDVVFDGKRIHGVLLNQPDSLKSVKEGDSVTVSPKQIVDWIYSVMGEVCGGFTIQKMRLGMDAGELKSHDDAWGLDFGDPGGIRLVPETYLEDEWKNKRTRIPKIDGMFIYGDFKKLSEMEHPMSINMRPSLEEQAVGNSDLLNSTDESGFNMLHSLAIAGSYDGVDVCLNNGMDPNQKAANGATPISLAKQLGWSKVVKRLEQASGS